MSKAGRKNKFDSHVRPFLDKVQMWRRDGHTEEQIAKMLGVGVSSFANYKNDYEELREVLRLGNEDLTADLEKTLYQRAKGFEYEEVKTTIEKDDKGRDRKKIEKTKKLLAPDTTALIFSLKNLKPEKWRDKQHIAHEGQIGITNLEYLTDEELEKELKGMKGND